MPTPAQIRHLALMARVHGLKVPIHPVCCGHQSPGRMLAQLVYDRPGMVLWQGPRGGGKSLLSGYSIYASASKHDRFSAKILGGSLAQSRQIYEALETFRDARPEFDTIAELLKTEALFFNGSKVEMLTASPTSVRGPHVPQLHLDEVDEIEEDIRESAMGMAMAKGNLRSSVVMTSTWHRISGPMATLVKRGQDGEFPVGIFCAFDILERCPDERSGPAPEYPGCMTCPIKRWCHDDRDRHPQGLPKAKRSCGHYSIDSLCDKTYGVSDRVFESDYLCKEPRARGMWFTGYDDALHCTDAAEYIRSVDYHVAIDPGVHTGAVLFQKRQSWDGTHVEINVFGDYYAENTDGTLTAEENGRRIAALAEELTGLPIGSARVSMDPASRQRSSSGHVTVGEYQRAYCVGRDNTIEPWPYIGPGRPKVDTLQLIEALLQSAAGTVGLRIHPRCRHLRSALKSYIRKQVNGQFLDEPESPQHPAEELVDSLAGGLMLEMPEGRTPQTRWPTVPASRLV